MGELLYGIELNILDKEGHTDLEEELLSILDYAIASMHAQNYKSGTVEQNTEAYINAMKNPHVKVLGHCDNPHYPVDYEALAKAAKDYNVIFEINEASLAPTATAAIPGIITVKSFAAAVNITFRSCFPATATEKSISEISLMLLNLYIKKCSRKV